jgi:hypothetical protein
MRKIIGDSPFAKKYHVSDTVIIKSTFPLKGYPETNMTHTVSICPGSRFSFFLLFLISGDLINLDTLTDVRKVRYEITDFSPII